MSARKPGATHNRADCIAVGATTATSIGAKYLRKPRLRADASELKNGGVCVSIMPDGTRAPFAPSRTRAGRQTEHNTARGARLAREQALRVKAGYIGNVE